MTYCKYTFKYQKNQKWCSTLYAYRKYSHRQVNGQASKRWFLAPPRYVSIAATVSSSTATAAAAATHVRDGASFSSFLSILFLNRTERLDYV